jgi:hypothetical protein
MRAYIQKLHSKPHHVRKQILIGLLAVSMSFVVFVWIYGLGYRFNTTTANQARSDIRPFQLFSQSIKGVYNNIRASVANAPSLNADTAPKKADNKQIDVIPVER